MMLAGKHYRRAPIAEAVIEIRCVLPGDVSLQDLLPTVDREEFPVVERAMTLENRVEISDEGMHSQTTGRQFGHVFRRADGSRVVQVRLDGFSFSRLPPYDRWEAFVEEAEKQWTRYRRLAKPERVTRLGVRFINKLEIPSPQVEIKDYLRIAVDVPAYLPQRLSGYFLQTEVPLERFACVATITSTIELRRTTRPLHSS